MTPLLLGHTINIIVEKIFDMLIVGFSWKTKCLLASPFHGGEGIFEKFVLLTDLLA
jgi:hypothetical protein